MSKLKDLVNKLSELTLMEAAELFKMLEEAWGVSAAAPVAVAASPAASATPAAEKTSFDVVLAEVGGKKLEVIKVVREITGLGLKEAKELVEAAPKPIKTGVGKDEANDIKAKLEAAEAKINLV